MHYKLPAADFCVYNSIGKSAEAIITASLETLVTPPCTRTGRARPREQGILKRTNCTYCIALTACP